MFSIFSCNLVNSKLKVKLEKNDFIFSDIILKLLEAFSISLFKYLIMFSFLYISSIISFSSSVNSFFFSSFFAPKKKLKALANTFEFLSSKIFFSTFFFVAFNILLSSVNKIFSKFSLFSKYFSIILICAKLVKSKISHFLYPTYFLRFIIVLIENSHNNL